jgi:hypothetical protein
MGFFVRNGAMTQPLFGYDTSLPLEEGLYRLLTLVTLQEGVKRGLLVHASGGVGKFKKVRGGESVTEYNAVFTKHLPRKKAIAVEVDRRCRRRRSRILRRWIFRQRPRTIDHGRCHVVSGLSSGALVRSLFFRSNHASQHPSQNHWSWKIFTETNCAQFGTRSHVRSPAGWVERRNGVRERRWVTDETSSFMSAEAAREALDEAKLKPEST